MPFARLKRHSVRHRVRGYSSRPFWCIIPRVVGTLSLRIIMESFMMTPRDRWLALFAGKDPGKVLCDYWATGEVTSRLQKDLNCPTERALFERLGVDKLVML